MSQRKFNPEDIEGKHRNATVAQIVEDYLRSSESAGRRALKDIRSRPIYWKSLWPDRAVRSIVPQDIGNARLELAGTKLKSNRHKTAPIGGRSAATLNRYLATLKAAFTLAVRNGKADKNPVSLVRLTKENNKRIRWLTADDEARLFWILPKDLHPLVLIALHTGMRKSEQLTLRWQDIDLQRKLIHVVQTEAGDPRHLPMNDVVIHTLQSLPRMLHNPYVFHGRKPGEYGIKNTDWKGYLPALEIFIGMTGIYSQDG